MGIAAKPTMIKPNLDEIRMLTGTSCDSIGEMIEAAKQIHKSGVEIVAVSLGAEGALVVRHMGIYQAQVPKMEAVLPLMESMPSACESEMHVCVQQQEIFDYLMVHDIQPIGCMPLCSPQRPERDMCPEDVADLQTPEMQEIAKAHGCHPALIALKWAHQRGQIPIPFSVHEAE